MTWIMVDIEADGPCPGLYSMVSLGAVVVEPHCTKCKDTESVWDSGDTTRCECVDHNGKRIRPDSRRTFYGQFKPIGDDWIAEALKVSGHTRSEVMKFPDPRQTIAAFAGWLRGVGGKPRFISDNNGFDWQFVNYYFHRFHGSNPFGFSSTNLGSLYKGMVKDMRMNFKHLRKTKHTHDPVDDAKGNAEAMIAMRAEGLKT